jgi:hypothetical protein
MVECEERLGAEVVITGLGSASLPAVIAIAKGLELPVELVVDAAFRAPARLLANVSEPDAQRLVEIVRGLGLHAEALPAGMAPPRAEVLDVAGHLIDPRQAEAAAAALARTLGMTAVEVLAALLDPPGMLLGNVTQATVEALEQHLPPGALALTAAHAAGSRYAVFAASPSAVPRATISALLPGRDLGVGARGWTLFDLTRAEADCLWRRLQPAEGLRIVNQAFLRFTLVLEGAPADGAAALQALAGVPPQDFELLRPLLPVAVERHVPFAALQERLAQYTAAGCEVRAELSTFAAVQLDILSAPPGLLQAEGFQARAPFRTPSMVEPRARVLRARLEAAGAEVLEVA